MAARAPWKSSATNRPSPDRARTPTQPPNQLTSRRRPVVATQDNTADRATDGLGTVVITGAAGGLGRAFALGFARRGYPVAAVDINADGIAETVQAVTEAGGCARGFTADVTDTASTDELARQANDFATSLETTVHAVVNNAAIYATINRSAFENIDPYEWAQR